MTRTTWLLLLLFGLCLLVSNCMVDDSKALEKLNSSEAERVQFFVNSPSTRPQNERNLRPSEILVETIDRAQYTLDACVYGFSKENVIDAVVRAHYRGVTVRVVGDAKHFGFGERGYRMIQEQRIPMQVGNQFHIMHNKFFVIDERFTFVGTGNITTTGFTKNSNNWIMIDSEQVADDFGAEFQQMFDGRFSTAKIRNNNGNSYKVGDTQVEVYFSPHEDTMGKMLEELDKADTSVHFQIFAFTKDQVGSRFIRLHERFTAENMKDGSHLLPVLERPKKVVGIMDKSQIHGNSQYHEIYRMLSRGVPTRIDANINSFTPGDYQAGGGRLHTKTMILDFGTPNARILSGSFNWSSAATTANDEVLLVLRGERIVKEFMKEWMELWRASAILPEGICSNDANAANQLCAPDVNPGDIVISEVHWDGWNGLEDGSDQSYFDGRRDPLSNDEFIELYNTTDTAIDISMWAIYNGFDAQMGFTPGTIIGPKQYFLVVDHNLRPFNEALPQREVEAFKNPDFLLNLANDPRFPRLNIKNSALRLELRAPQDTTSANPPMQPKIIDSLGDYGVPYAGGRTGLQNRSMERIFVDGKPLPNGDDPKSWKTCSLQQGGANVNDAFKDKVIATPGEPNSP